MVDAPGGVKPSLSSMHPPARCTTLPTGRKPVVQQIYRHVSYFPQLFKGVSTLVERVKLENLTQHGQVLLAMPVLSELLGSMCNIAALGWLHQRLFQNPPFAVRALGWLFQNVIRHAGI